MYLKLDTINKTVTLTSQSFKLDELISKLEELKIVDWTIIVEGFSTTISSPYIYGVPNYGTGGSIPCISNTTTTVPNMANCTYTK